MDKQKIKSLIEKRLEETNCFLNLKIRGDLDVEHNHLLISYKENPESKDFRKVKQLLENKINKVISNYYTLGLIQRTERIEEFQEYRTDIIRNPTEGMPHNLTLEFLSRLYEEIKDRYVFE